MILRRVLVNESDVAYNFANYIEASTNTVKTIDFRHHEAHEGDRYYYKDYIDLTNGASRYFTITVPDTTTWPHAVFEIGTEAETNITVYEGTVTSANGTLIPAFNRNRNSANVPVCLLHHTPTVTSNGTQIAAYKTGSGKLSGGQAGFVEELILKQNTKYLLHILNATTSNNWIDILFDWYEHANND